MLALERCLDKNPLFSGNEFDALPAVGIHVVSKLVEVGSGDVDVIRGAALAVFECVLAELMALTALPADAVDERDEERIGSGAD